MRSDAVDNKDVKEKGEKKQDKRFHRLQASRRSQKSFLHKLFSNRYAFLVIIIFLTFALMLLRTADLQLFGQSTHTALESRGSNSELSLS
ncbi:MAG: hypothetical protein PHR78_07555, partial [Eubacteriales bacterium]|nr:hypothetical protein [Eubacteriales bacterium]